ncbi:MAG: EAL domain-containing protein, partial [Gammaproteobacteria bacterium]|nr:EAL domain-containing protein [Gammaproteobacteria bacterium]
MGLERKTTILIVDDDKVTRTVTTKLLQQANYHVVTACNGLEGVELFHQHNPELVLMDVMMPEMNGFQACAEIRKNSDVSATPILMLTGLDDLESIEEAFNSGATDFITKPINWSLLTRRIKYALRTRELYSVLEKKQSILLKAQHLAKLGYYEYDVFQQRLVCSPETLVILGFSPDMSSISIQQFLSRVPKPERETITQAFDYALQNRVPVFFNHHIKRPGKPTLIIHQQGELLVSDKEEKIFSITIQDITERKQVESVLEFQKYFDPLTKLPNSKHMEKSLKEFMLNADENETLLAIFMVKPDRFRDYNDTLGPEFGNELLKLVSLRLQSVASESNTYISRYSGSSFSLIFKDIFSIEEVEVSIESLLTKLSQPYKIFNEEHHVTFSMGSVLYPLDNYDRDTLIAGADQSLSMARKQGGNRYCMYSRQYTHESEKKLNLERELRVALKSGQLKVYYQPQISTKSGELVGVEALARWLHPEKGFISPLEFIPIAEETDLILKLGEQILNEACNQGHQWMKDGLGGIRIGVNFSPRQFSDPNIVDVVQNAIEESGLSPHLLEIEITESIALGDKDKTLATLASLKNLGICLSIDDFGTGYSSLSYLQDLPLDTLKIDRSFIKDIGTTAQSG